VALQRAAAEGLVLASTNAASAMRVPSAMLVEVFNMAAERLASGALSVVPDWGDDSAVIVAGAAGGPAACPAPEIAGEQDENDGGCRGGPRADR
jgi:hypothetical protein